MVNNNNLFHKGIYRKNRMYLNIIFTFARDKEVDFDRSFIKKSKKVKKKKDLENKITMYKIPVTTNINTQRRKKNLYVISILYD